MRVAKERGDAFCRPSTCTNDYESAGWQVPSPSREREPGKIGERLVDCKTARDRDLGVNPKCYRLSTITPRYPAVRFTVRPRDEISQSPSLAGQRASDRQLADSSLLTLSPCRVSCLDTRASYFPRRLKPAHRTPARQINRTDAMASTSSLGVVAAAAAAAAPSRSEPKPLIRASKVSVCSRRGRPVERRVEG